MFNEGDIAQIVSGQQYLRGLEVVILKVLPVNVKVRLLKPELGRRFGEGPFYANPSYLKFVRKSDGSIPATVVTDNDGEEDIPDTLTSGLTMRDFKPGDKVRIASWAHPTYLANQIGRVVKKRRVKLAISLDNPPIGTRFAHGVIIRPSRLFKV